MSSGFTVGIVDTSDRGGEREKRGLYALVVPEYLGVLMYPTSGRDAR